MACLRAASISLVRFSFDVLCCNRVKYTLTLLLRIFIDKMSPYACLNLWLDLDKKHETQVKQYCMINKGVGRSGRRAQGSWSCPNYKVLAVTCFINIYPAKIVSAFGALLPFLTTTLLMN